MAVNYPTRNPRNTQRQQSPASNVYTNVLNKGNLYQQMGMALQMLNYVDSIMLNPQSSAEQMQLAMQLKERANQMLQAQEQAATPFGVDFQTGSPRTGVFGMGETHDKYNDEILSQMNPAAWGQMQQAANPEVAKIYKDSEKAESAARNYLGMLNRQYNAPATWQSDPITGQRTNLVSAPNQQDLSNEITRYKESLPPWMKL